MFVEFLSLTADTSIFLKLTERLKNCKPIVRQLSLNENDLLCWLDHVSHHFSWNDTLALASSIQTHFILIFEVNDLVTWTFAAQKSNMTSRQMCLQARLTQSPLDL